MYYGEPIYQYNYLSIVFNIQSCFPDPLSFRGARHERM